MAKLEGVTVGRYFLLECLVREGMVETYRARPTNQGGFDVSLRLFRPPFSDPSAFHEHFASEVEKVWHCRHDHIQPLLEFGAGDDLLFDVTEITGLNTLEQVLQNTEHQEIYCSTPMILHTITQLCATLDYAHEQQIVHGNIQPSNILIQHNQDILLTNFSLKHIYQEGEPLVAQTEEGNAAYMAPEQAIGMVTPASDIYSVGVLLYRMLTGHLPYDGESAGEIALKHASEAIPSLQQIRPDLPADVELVVRVALAKSPEARFPNANELARALNVAITKDNPQVISVKPQRRMEVRSRQRTFFTWSHASSLLAIILVIGGLIGTLDYFSSLPSRIQGISGFPFHDDKQGRIVETRLSKSTPTAVSSGITPTTLSQSTPTLTTSGIAPTTPASSGSNSTPEVRIVPTTPSSSGSNSTPEVRITPTVAGSQTPIATGTFVPPNVNTGTFACVPGKLMIDSTMNLQPLLHQIDVDYTNNCPEMMLSLMGEDSHVSLNKLEHGQIDVAGTDSTSNARRNLSDLPIGALLFAMIVSPDVGASNLSSAEIQEIFQGQITNWAQVGGSDKAITLILPSARESLDPILQSFALDTIVEQGNTIRNMNDSSALIAKAVLQTPGAMSFVPLVIAQQMEANILTIDGVAPGMQAVQDGTYTFWSVEHLYTAKAESASFQAYMQFLNGSLERHVLSAFGLVPIQMLDQRLLLSRLPAPVR